MRQRPRPARAPLLDRPSLRFVVGVGGMKAALALSVLGVLPLCGYSLEIARTAAFHFMAVGQLCLVYPARHTEMRPVKNPYLSGAVFGGVGLQLAAASLPATAALLGAVALPAELWGVVAISALLAWSLAEAYSRVIWRQRVP